MRIVRCTLRVVLGTVLFLAALSTAHAADNYFLKIQGARQGAFNGPVKRPGGQWIPLLAFNMEVIPPHDAATGQASGKRQHKPITVRKKTDQASPQIFKALATGEMLNTVVIQVVRPVRGKEQVFQTVTLTNAVVSKAQKLGGKTGPAKDTNEIEEISFTFQKIQVTNVNGKVTASDDWTQSK